MGYIRREEFVLLSVLSVLSCVASSLFSDLMITTAKSTFSVGKSILGTYSPSFCWCGPHSKCWIPRNDTDTGTKECTCWEGYEGVAPNCRPSPELWASCFVGNPCGPNSECSLQNGTRNCECMLEFDGTPPDCHLPKPESESCIENNTCGPNSVCHPFLGQQCACAPGFVEEPPNCTAGAELLARCDPYPCGGFSECTMKGGAPVCRCLTGYVGTPPDCQPGPEVWRVCFKDRPCGLRARCDVVERAAVCSPCPEGDRHLPHC